jgi:hypothetical protein
VRTLLLSLVLSLVPGLAVADDGDDTLRHYLAKADVVVLGEFTSEPVGFTKEAGVVSYGADFKIAQLIKGAAQGDRRVGGTIPVNVVRFESHPEDRLPYLKKGGQCILFLKASDCQPNATYITADVWFGVQRPGPWLARSLSRLAQEKAGNAR